MATRYSDIITLGTSRTVYNIREEGPKDWESFIANDQFNALLDKTVKAVMNNDPDNHKSIWMAGTYGSGKSHAGAVLKHLLCDPVNEIMHYVDLEYNDPKFGLLRSNLLSLRDSKRLFPVSLYGQQSISHEADLSLQIQREVKSALEAAGLHLNVKTDYDTYVEHIEQNPDFWTMLIERSPKLASLTPDIKKLVSDLRNCDSGVLDKVNAALRENRLDVRMDSKNLCKWLIQVQDKLREEGTYNGLLLVWDEFTEIATSPAIGVKLLERLQEISDTLMSPEHDSYFLLISHPSALNALSEEKRNQTIGRYNYFTYNMETVSAFKIMSRKFNVIDQEGHQSIVEKFYKIYPGLLEDFSNTSNQPEETKKDLKKLFPLHPATADLATHYAREAGSSSRSVFEFLACNAVRAFFDDELIFANGSLITADYLWDYVREAFNEDSAKFGAVTEKYDTYHLKVEHEGEAFTKVFKGILLLNALNNIAHKDSVTPTIENINNLFRGTEIAKHVDEALNFFNDKSIIQRLPGDVFSIQFTALPGQEIEDIKKDLKSGQFKFTDQVAKFADIVTGEFNKAYANIARPFRIEIYSPQANEYTLVNKIENGKKASKGYEIFIAALVARNFDELSFLKTKAYDWNQSGKLKDVVVMIFDSCLEQKNYDSFIDFMANATCAQRHGLTPQQETYTKNAKNRVKEWAAKLKGGNVTYYINGLEDTIAGIKVASTINSAVAPLIFTSGPETLQLIQSKFSKTYWQKAAVKKAVDAVLQFNSKEEILKNIPGQGKHVEYIFQDSVESDLTWKSDVDPEHPLKKVCAYIDKVFKNTNKNQEFNLGEKLKDLSLAPYGLYQSYAGMGMVAFAMRKYVKQIFDLNGKPREARHIVDDVCEMFKAWEDGKKSNKLNFMFESRESSELCKYLIDIFKLKQLPGYKDVSSLTDARWAILEYAKKQGFPLWALKYSGCSEAMTSLIDDIVKICDPNGLANQDLINDASKSIKKQELDLNLLLVETDVFKKGFMTFLMQDPKVKFKPEEFEPLYNYLLKHLQGEIGRWSESEVQLQELYWRMEGDNGDNGGGNGGGSSASGGNSYPTTTGDDTDVVNDDPGNDPYEEERKEKAKSVIANASDEQVRKAIEKVIENEDKNIVNIILKYVQ